MKDAGSGAPLQGRSPPATFRIENFDCVPSTQDLCIARADSGELEGLVIVARRQSAGQGRHGRRWESAEGNLAVSVLLRPTTAPADLPQWSLLAGVALIEALAVHSTAQLQLKWPNDVTLNGAKLAGILLNAAPAAWLVIGVGVNLASAPSLPDRDTARLPNAVAPRALAETFLDRLNHWSRLAQADGMAAIRTAWLSHAHPVGTTLRVPGPPPAEGSFSGLAPNGALLMQTRTGEIRIAGGDVTIGRR